MILSEPPFAQATGAVGTAPAQPSAPAPLIEVLCVAYRRYGPLKVLVQSWLNQTATNWRLKVYHDGPDAEFDRIMEGYAREAGPKVAYFHTEHRFNDYGHSLRDLALRQAGGDYVLLTNDDNYYVPRLLEFLTGAICTTGADVVMFDMVHSHDNPGCRPLPAYSYFQTQYGRGNIDMGAAIVRSDLARAAGFRDKSHDGDATYFEDVARLRGGPLSVCKISRTLFVHN